MKKILLMISIISLVPASGFSGSQAEFRNALKEKKLINDADVIFAGANTVLSNAALAFEKDPDILNKINSETDAIKLAVRIDGVANGLTGATTPVRNQLRLLVTQVSKDAAVSLGFPGVSAGISADYIYFYGLYTAYSEISATDDSPTQYLGYGVKLMIKIKNVSGNIKADLPYIAAQATLEASDSSFDFRVFGMDEVSSVKLSKELISFSKFDVETYGGFLNVKRSLIEMIEAKSINVQPSLFAMPEVTEIVTANSRAAYVYGIRSIAAGKSINEILPLLPADSHRFLPEIDLAYSEVAGILKRNVKPNKLSIKKATTLLAQFP